MQDEPIDFGPIVDTSKNIIKVIGVGGGGCNAVRNMFLEEVPNVTYAVSNTDSQALSKSPVRTKILLGKSGLGAGGDPDKGREDAELNAEDIRRLCSDGTQMAFIAAGMGGGTGTGAAPVIAGIVKSMGILTVGIVTIPFYFEKRRKIIKALKGIEEMKKNVDALLVINNEKLCDIYADSHVPLKEAFRRADKIIGDAAESISELISVEGDMNLDFHDVETIMRGGGGAVMAMGRARGEHRVQNAILDALDSPLVDGNDRDIGTAKRILLNIYTSTEHPMFVDETSELDAFMEAINPDVEFIYGFGDDDSLGEDCKVTILASGMDESLGTGLPDNLVTDDDYDRYIAKLYHKSFVKKGPKTDDGQKPDNGPNVNGDDAAADDNDLGGVEVVPPTITFIDKVKAYLSVFTQPEED